MAGFCDIINFQNKIDNFKKLSNKKENIKLVFNDKEKNIQDLIKKDTNTSKYIITDCIEIKPFEKCIQNNNDKLEYNSCYKCVKYYIE